MKPSTRSHKSSKTSKDVRFDSCKSKYEGQITISSDVNLRGSLSSECPVYLSVIKPKCLNSQIILGGDVKITENLNVDSINVKSITTDNVISSSGTINLIGNTNTTGSHTVNGDLIVNGTTEFRGNVIFPDSFLNSSSSASLQTSSKTKENNGITTIIGDLHVKGNITIDGLISNSNNINIKNDSLSSSSIQNILISPLSPSQTSQGSLRVKTIRPLTRHESIIFKGDIESSESVAAENAYFTNYNLVDVNEGRKSPVPFEETPDMYGEFSIPKPKMGGNTRHFKRLVTDNIKSGFVTNIGDNVSYMSNIFRWRARLGLSKEQIIPPNQWTKILLDLPDGDGFVGPSGNPLFLGYNNGIIKQTLPEPFEEINSNVMVSYKINVDHNTVPPLKSKLFFCLTFEDFEGEFTGDLSLMTCKSGNKIFTESFFNESPSVVSNSIFLTTEFSFGKVMVLYCLNRSKVKITLNKSHGIDLFSYPA